jgi:hypothetical protein
MAHDENKSRASRVAETDRRGWADDGQAAAGEEAARVGLAGDGNGEGKRRVVR